MSTILSILIFIAPFLVAYNSRVPFVNNPIFTFIWFVLIVVVKILIRENISNDNKAENKDYLKVIWDLKEISSYLASILVFITIVTIIELIYSALKQ